MFPSQTKEAVTAIKDQKCKNTTELFVCFFLFKTNYIRENETFQMEMSVGTPNIAFR